MRNVNTAECRRLEIMHLLSLEHVMSHADLMKATGLGKSSVWKYLYDLVHERKVRAKFTLPKKGSKKPVTYYCLRIPK